jgi:hypothetical protein
MATNAYAAKRHRGLSEHSDTSKRSGKSDYSLKTNKSIYSTRPQQRFTEEEEVRYYRELARAAEEAGELKHVPKPKPTEERHRGIMESISNAMDLQFLHIFHDNTSKAAEFEAETLAQEKRQREYDSLDEIDFEENPNPVGYRYPLLTVLIPVELRRFRIELEAAEEMRVDMNRTRESHRKLPRPEPRMLVHRKLWGVLCIELQKINPNINHFLDATYEEFYTWLIRALVPPPNNRPLLKRLENKLQKAWAQSYFFGAPKSLFCFPSSRRDSTYDDIWDSEDGKKEKEVDPKKLSTTSSITVFSFERSSAARPSLPSISETHELLIDTIDSRDVIEQTEDDDYSADNDNERDTDMLSE